MDEPPPAPDPPADAPRFRRESSHVRSRTGFAWDGVAAEVVEREATAEATFDLLLPFLAGERLPSGAAPQ